MPEDPAKLLGETLAAPLGDVIASIGGGVADAQAALDEASIAQTLEIYRDGGEDLLKVLREIGYRPTFYALPDTTGEVNVAMRLSGSNTVAPPRARPAKSIGPGIGAISPATLAAIRKAPTPRIYATPVDAAFQNRFGYQAEASAKLTFKIVPVPPPAELDDMRVIPDLDGRLVSLALEVLDTLGMQARFRDSEGVEVEDPDPAFVVTGQEPAAETVATTETTIELTIGPAEDE